MIVAENLRRNYGDFVAVDSVSFEIKKGEIVGLLGHNGAGKTTIMKMITGFLEPSDGSITVDGLDLETDRLSIQSKIGYLPENCPLYSEMTVIDYLEYVAGLRDIPEEQIQSAVKKVIQKTELESKAASLISTLSRGYRQRVGVAQAIIHEPEILILDEPTNGLDPSQIHGMRSLIQDLSANATVIVSTHILQEVQAICDRAIIIRQGKVALDSRLEDIQASNFLVLSVDQGPDETKKKLSDIVEIKSVDHVEQKQSEHVYRLVVEQNGHDVRPHIAKALVTGGANLFALHSEKRDLETVFREINLNS